MDPLEPMKSEHCRTRCPLYVHLSQEPLPPVLQYAWRLFTDLNSPAVQRFGLVDDVLECHGLDTTTDDFMDLVYYLNAIIEGVQEWYEENPKKDGKER